MDLPLRQQKDLHTWRRYYNQMGQHFVSSGGERRQWIIKEVMAYIDCDVADREFKRRSSGGLIIPKEGNRRGQREVWE